MVNNRKILLLDTPGFDDSAVGNLEVLNEIASNLYTFARERQEFQTQGVIFLHDISENRFAGSQRKTLEILTALCGPKGLKNCIIGTTMWSPPESVRFENEVIREKDFLRSYWRGILKTTRILENDRDAVVGIINDILARPPVLLQVQEEMLRPPHTLETTTAGKIAIPEGRAEAEQLRKEFEDKQRAFKEERKKLEIEFERETERYRLQCKKELAKQEAERQKLDRERWHLEEQQDSINREHLRDLNDEFRRRTEDEQRWRRIEDDQIRDDERRRWEDFIQLQQKNAEIVEEDRKRWYDQMCLYRDEEARKAHTREEERIRLLKEEFKKTTAPPPKPKWWEPVVGAAITIINGLFKMLRSQLPGRSLLFEQNNSLYNAADFNP